jgi:hypothetical protein
MIPLAPRSMPMYPSLYQWIDESKGYSAARSALFHIRLKIIFRGVFQVHSGEVASRFHPVQKLLESSNLY